jgi:hypothetical protein
LTINICRHKVSSPPLLTKLEADGETRTVFFKITATKEKEVFFHPSLADERS